MFNDSSWNSKMSEQTIRTMEIFYRAIQVHHIYAKACIRLLSPFAVLFGTVFTISILFVLISRRELLEIFTLSWMVVSILLIGSVTKIFCATISQYTDASVDHIASFNQCTGLRKVDRLFYRSCSHLELEVAYMFTFQRDTVIILGQFVFEKVVDLLLTFPT